MLLIKEKIHPVLYWNNPNIHPLLEYNARLEALRTYAEMEHRPLIVDGEYGLRAFTKAVAADVGNRCDHCYASRLEATARHARAHGFDAFSTTLTISPYQDTERIWSWGEEAGAQHGVQFIRFDFRPFFRAGQERIRSMDLYMQKYCGCIYSEEDRYARKKEKIKRGFNPNFPTRPCKEVSHCEAGAVPRFEPDGDGK